MLITEILERVTYSVDFCGIENYESPEAFWQHIIKQKSSDSGFDRLVQSYLSDGWQEGSTVGIEEDFRGNLEITEGHHRLVLAILLCLDEVPTSMWGSDSYADISAHHDARLGPRLDYLCDEV